MTWGKKSHDTNYSNPAIEDNQETADAAYRGAGGVFACHQILQILRVLRTVKRKMNFTELAWNHP